MLKVTFEIIPFGDETHPRRREVGHLNISFQKNVNDVDHYISTIVTDGQHVPPYEHIQIIIRANQGPFELVRQCLAAHLYTKEKVNDA